ncbi:response regulator [Actinoplanes sp. RD1]|uniref:response regulator n=1 Tax=Actinoplanes sp. RD1 TaxID=3064538 RepID=UPI0027404FF0|nr:response regulator transcription factor [Actinoplanes sp. RD1]
MAVQRVLVVDDETKIRMTARGYLEADGFEVVEAADGTTALALATRDRLDLVILDVMLPGPDGLHVLRKLRETSQVPVILLTALSEEVDRLIGFTAGADDYVTKPFSPRELVLRARAILRRTDTGAEPDATLRFQGLVIDPATRTVLRDDEQLVELSPLDFDLLVAMARTPGRVYTRRGLLAEVWGGDFFGDERVIDVHVRTLRKALGDDAGTPRFVGTVRTVGYRFVGVPR